MFKPAKFIVVCERHGKRNADNIPELAVAKPRNKRERIGCPLCRREETSKRK